MTRIKSFLVATVAAGAWLIVRDATTPSDGAVLDVSGARVNRAVIHDVSAPLGALRHGLSAAADPCDVEPDDCGLLPAHAAAPRSAIQSEPERPFDAAPVAAGGSASAVAQGASIEQTAQGARASAVQLESFDGQGFGMVGPHGTGGGRNPSDNSMAAGPDHIVEIVNSRMAVYTKRGRLFAETGKVLFGPIGTNVIFSGFGGQCEPRPNGDAVVRYDQLAERWLFVMPLFRRAPSGPGEPPGPYGMCYAVSAGPNPLGPYYRYEFERTLFPDYPRPAIWPDGYYIPTSTGDDVIEKHACVLDRTRVLLGLPATEQCIIIKDVNFLNNADIDGHGLPPAGAPNLMMAAGGTQLRKDFDDDGIYVWKFHVDWENPAKTAITGPQKIAVAPYHYLCDGQLTRCVPQPGTDMRLDAQGDKIMQRLVYRNIGGRESIVAVHSVNTTAGGGGVRWYEFRLDERREPRLYQQGTYAPDGFYRWMGSPGMDRQGNIGIGYSFGGAPNFAGQRFAGRLADDPKGVLTFHETVLVHGQAAQTNTLRWQDYTQTSMDPTDDCTFWYVGDYLKEGAENYTTRIGSFRFPGCLQGTVSGTSFFDVNHNGVREPNEAGLENWPVTYEGVRRQRDAMLAPSATLLTDSAGRFSIQLPADSAYSVPVYRFTAAVPSERSWSRIRRGTAYWSGGAIPMSDDAYSVAVRDRDDVVGVDFGQVCVIANSGGADPGFWATGEGRSVLATNDQPLPEPGGRAGGAGRGRGGTGGWRATIDNQLWLVAADGNRFTVPGQGSFEAAHARLAAFLDGAVAGGEGTQPGTALHRLSVQLTATALNIAYGRQAGEATVHEPVRDDWPTIIALTDRVSALLRESTEAGAAPATTTADAHTTLLREINRNNAMVTPADPGRCPPAR